MRFTNLKITTKVVLLASVPLLLLGTVLAYGWYESLSRSLVAGVADRDRGIANALAAHMRVELAEHYNLGFAAQSSIRAHADGVGHLLLAEITTPEGKVLAAQPAGSAGKTSFDREEIVQVAASGRPLEQLVAFEHGNIRDFTKVDSLGPWITKPTAHEFMRPIRDSKGEVVAVVHLYLSTANVPLQLRRTLLISAGAVAAFLLISVLSLLWAGRRFVEQPLDELTKTAEAISEGNLYIRAPAGSKDEIGMLGRAFNSMTDSLLHMEVRADTDALTGLYNFRHFQRFLERQVELGAQAGRSFALAIMDIDHFKDINDNYGHPTGDRVLAAIGDYLRRTVRAADYVARYGGEEFVVIFPELGSTEAFEICDRLRAGLPKEVAVSNGGTRPVEVSIGLADYPAVASSADNLLQAADAALLHAKKNGRNQVVHFDSLPTRTSERQNVEAIIEKMRMSQLRTITDLVDHVESTEYGEPGHAQHVAETAANLARGMGLKQAEVESIYKAGKVHDVGKISIPQALLAKPDPLSTDEMELIRSHPVVGEKILRAISDIGELIPAVLYHHERWDGEGYPRRLAGEDIPVSARILAIAEGYEAMISDRSYRKALSDDLALLELRRNAGTQFDPQLVEAFIRQKARESQASA